MKWTTILLTCLATLQAQAIHPSVIEDPNLRQIPVDYSEHDCSRDSLTTIDPLDCDEAIHIYKRRYAEDEERIWHWTHNPAARWRFPILAPNTTSYGTCSFTIDFVGDEDSPGAMGVSTIEISEVGFNVIDDCVLAQKREGGRGYAFSGRVFYILDIGATGVMEVEDRNGGEDMLASDE